MSKILTEELIEQRHWFNNFLSTERFREYYGLGMAEAENVIDQGRKINHKRK